MIVSAIVEPDGSGINIRAKNEKGEVEGLFTPAETWGKIPVGKNPAVELEKIARILNGYRENQFGEWEVVENFKPKIINLNIE
jgi:hypothetical protein